MIELNETDVRELSWVADVLDNGGPGFSVQANLTRQDLADLANVIRSKVTEPAPEMSYDEAVSLVRAALDRLDGTELAAVSLLTGVPVEELNDLGGVA